MIRRGLRLRVFVVAGIAIVVFTAGGGVFLYLRGRWAAQASEAIARDIRNRVYAHLDRFLVEKGQKVARGDIIARSGNSGRSSAPHLHYEVRIGDRPVNPVSYILDSYAGLP